MIRNLPTVACFCPTYGRPKLVQNALACFNAQDYPANLRRLYILDSANQFKDHDGPNWSVVPMATRPMYLVHKYKRLMDLVLERPTPSLDNNDVWTPPQAPDIVCVWDDDDVYLPHHISSHIEALTNHNEWPARHWSQPLNVWSDYGNKLHQEKSAGRFHGSIAISWALLTAVGGWTQCGTGEDFDQRFIGLLTQQGQPERPDIPQRGYPPGYVYRWGSTGYAHSSSHRAQLPLQDNRKIDLLVPQFDQTTISYYQQLQPMNI